MPGLCRTQGRGSIMGWQRMRNSQAGRKQESPDRSCLPLDVSLSRTPAPATQVRSGSAEIDADNVRQRLPTVPYRGSFAELVVAPGGRLETLLAAKHTEEAAGDR